MQIKCTLFQGRKNHKKFNFYSQYQVGCVRKPSGFTTTKLLKKLVEKHNLMHRMYIYKKARFTQNLGGVEIYKTGKHFNLMGLCNGRLKSLICGCCGDDIYKKLITGT